ncbi:MAG: FAD-dependent oxidoreductase [Caldilineaceae bacterium]|nr:FAD-dependent oxidoreductase [Caldilineaceae bacterium]
MAIKKYEALVIGAGLAGIAAARELHAAGVDLLLLDKRKRVGGRMATRRIGQGAADHGAQFFTAESPEFQALVDGWEAEGFAYLWDIGWSTGSFTDNEGPDHTHYAVSGGMSRLMEHLAVDLPTETAVSVVAVRQIDGGWEAEAKDGSRYRSSGLILTPPPPQALQLLRAGDVHLSPMDAEILEQLTYSSTITGIFRIEGEVTIPAPGAVHRPAEPLPWIADNRQKKVSPEETVVTINSNGNYASRYWDAPEVEIIETMKSVLLHYLKPGSRISESQIKRWRYAFPMRTHSQRTLRASGTPPLYFAGDAFHGPLIEGAWLSGKAAATALLADPEFRMATKSGR